MFVGIFDELRLLASWSGPQFWWVSVCCGVEWAAPTSFHLFKWLGLCIPVNFDAPLLVRTLIFTSMRGRLYCSEIVDV